MFGKKKVKAKASKPKQKELSAEHVAKVSKYSDRVLLGQLKCAKNKDHKGEFVDALNHVAKERGL